MNDVLACLARAAVRRGAAADAAAERIAAMREREAS